MTFQNFLNDCDLTSVPNITRVYLKPRDTVGKFWYYEKTAQDNLGKIIGHQGSNFTWRELVTSNSEITFSQSESFNPARTYSQTITMRVSPKSFYNRDKFEQLSVTRNVCIAFEDGNGRWWLMGESFGCDLTTNSTINAEYNGYDLTFTALERAPIREISLDYVEGAILGQVIVLTFLSMSEFCTLDWNQVCTSKFY